MKNIYQICIFLFLSLSANAQTQEQIAFFDSCNNAINYYKDFLIKLTKGQSSFANGKRLFASSHKQLLELKANNEVPVNQEQYELLIKALENMKSKDFKVFITTEQKLKDKIRLHINGKPTILSKKHGVPLAVVLDILEIKLEPFNDRPAN